MSSDNWTTHQIVEFVGALSAYGDAASAKRGAVARVAESLEAEVAAIVADGHVESAIGFPRDDVPTALLVELASRRTHDVVDLPYAGRCEVVTVPLEPPGLVVLVGRTSDDPFGAPELALLRAMCRVLSQSLLVLATLEHERALRAQGDALLAQLTERQRLLERLSRIQRSISHRAPLQEVLDAITSGAREVLGGSDLAALRLIDPDRRGDCYIASESGIPDEVLPLVARGPLGEGAGGRAILENRLVVIDDYASDPNVVPAFRDSAMRTAMAAPVHENGEVVGSLVVASFSPARRYSREEREVLLALAEHASLALTDARTVEAMREAQRSKDLFLAMVSHELKTPLTVVMGTLRTLQQHHESLASDVRGEILGAAFSRGRELERLIDRLLRGARAELAGARRDIAVAELVHAGLNGFASVRPFAVDVADATVHVDAAAAAEIIGILTENAISHSPGDTPIGVIAHADDLGVSIGISNVGVLPEGTDPATLFLPFHRGHGARSSGVGLGLYIASRLAEAVGGSIDVASSDALVTFTLRLPHQPGSAARSRCRADDDRVLVSPPLAR